MITKNYKKGLSVHAWCKDNTQTTVKVTDVNGTARALYHKTGGGSPFSTGLTAMTGPRVTYTSITTYGVFFGDGTTPPTEDDYKLSGNILSAGSASAVSSATSDENGVTSTATYTITNGLSTSFTIREVVLVGSVYYSSNSTSLAYVVFDRTLLDTPVTIEPGAVGQVTYTIRQEW